MKAIQTKISFILLIFSATVLPSERILNAEASQRLARAIDSGNSIEVEILAKWGTELNQEVDGLPPLYRALNTDASAEIINILLRHGADPNAQESEWGSTPLMIATSKLNEQYVKLLFENGAVTYTQGNDGKTVFYHFGIACKGRIEKYGRINIDDKNRKDPSPQNIKRLLFKYSNDDMQKNDIFDDCFKEVRKELGIVEE